MVTVKKLGDLRGLSMRQPSGASSPRISLEMKELSAMGIDL
jgi:hypothetical protein